MAFVTLPLRPQDALGRSAAPAIASMFFGSGFPDRVLAFGPGAANEEAVWLLRASDYKAGASLTLELEWYADTASTGDVVWKAYLAALTPDTDTADVETKAFGAENSATETHLGTTGQRLHRTTLTISNLDALDLEDLCVLKVRREGGTMAGDALLVLASLKYESDASPEAGVGAALATMTFANDDASPHSNMPLRFGMPLRYGTGATSGEQLVLLDSLDNELPTQYDEVWRQDGAIRHCVLSTVLPSFSASSTQQIKVAKKAGAYAPSGVRTVAEIEALTIEVHADEVYEGTGSTVHDGGSLIFRVNDYINIPERVRKVATGPIRDVWEVNGEFRRTDTNARTTHLAAHVWIIGWSNPSTGALLRWEVMPAVHAAYINVAGARGLMAKLSTWVSGGKVRQLETTDVTFTSTDVNTTNDLVTEALPAMLNTARPPVRVSTTGTLPGGLSATTTYFLRRESASAMGFQTGEHGNDGLVDLTSGGSGTHTVAFWTLIPYRAWIFVCGTDAQPDIVGGAARPAVRPAMITAEKEYWLSTGIIPPVDLTHSWAAATTWTYYPNKSASTRQQINSTGGHVGIGPIPEWHCQHFALQSATALSTVRTNMLMIGGCHGMCVMDETIRSGSEKWMRTPPLNNGTDGAGAAYSGLPPVKPNTGCGLASPINAVQPSSPSESVFLESTGADASHWPSVAYPYIVDGDRWQLHVIWGSANRHIFSFPGGTRQRVVGGTTYYAVVREMVTAGLGRQHRSDAWNSREQVFAACLGGDDNPEKAYFQDVCRDNEAMMVALYAERGPEFAASGVTHELTLTGNSGHRPMWQGWFQIATDAWASKMRRTANAQAITDHNHKWAKQMWEGLCGGSPYYLDASQHVIRKIKGEAAYREFGTGAGNWVAIGNRSSLAMDGTFTLKKNGTGDSLEFGQNITLTDGDVVNFISDGSPTYPLPPEVTFSGVYYMRDVDNSSAKTFKLAASPGGAAITFSQAYADVYLALMPTAGPATGFFQRVEHAHADEGYGALMCAAAVGHAGMATAVANARARLPLANLSSVTQQWALSDAVQVV